LKRDFLIYFSLLILGVFTLIIFYIFDVVDDTRFASYRIAFTINIVNSGLALFLFYHSRNKSNKVFLLFNLGGMVFRLFLMLTIIIISIKFLEIDLDDFIFVFFIFYFLLLWYEIAFFVRNRQKKVIVSE